jgi:hypothetical protein
VRACLDLDFSVLKFAAALLAREKEMKK